MPFTRVDLKHAGPNALGILVPHGAKTLVIIRPRALPWDLLPANWDGDSSRAPQFCLFSRDEAAATARRLFRYLESAVAQGVNPVQTFGDAQAEHFQIWLRTEELVWIVCQRSPGKAYQPMIFTSLEQATQEAEKITRFVWPPAESRQEYYFNTQNFS
jgi:hypothetical protein